MRADAAPVPLPTPAAVLTSAPHVRPPARDRAPRLCARGGGPVGVTVRVLARDGADGGVIVVHLDVDCVEAMGANLVNTLCERLADDVAGVARGRVGLRILSNLSDQR